MVESQPSSAAAAVLPLALDALRDGVAVVQDGRLVYANPSFARLTASAPDVVETIAAVAPGDRPQTITLRDETGAPVELLVTSDLLPHAPQSCVIVVRRRSELLAEAVALAERDDLTGLLNRRGFESHAVAALRAAAHDGRPASLVLLDLDHFKRVNDEHGHPVGDRVLRETAERLRTVARPHDVLARIGGEELAWPLPDATAGQATAAGDRARAALAGAPLAEIVRITASVGVCELTGHGDVDGVYRRADQALYWAKAYGRNMTLIWTPDAAERLTLDGTRAARWEHLLSAAHHVDALLGGTCAHAARVADVAVALAVQLDWDARQQGRLHQAARLHDVGKVAVPPAVLSHPGRLDATQWAQVQQHAAVGAGMAAAALDDEQAGWIRHHHERWDGAGYPSGRAGDEIPGRCAGAGDRGRVRSDDQRPAVCACAFLRGRARRGGALCGARVPARRRRSAQERASLAVERWLTAKRRPGTSQGREGSASAPAPMLSP